MIKKVFGLAALSLMLLTSCGGKEEAKKNTPYKSPKKEEVKVEAPKEVSKTEEAKKPEEVKPSQRIALDNKGVGPIKSLTLDPEINQEMATKGAEVYKKMCTACHKPTKKFIGPAPKGILERRSPEWVMNMILDPEGMIKEDPLAKELLVEFNGSPMANQHLTKEDARAVLEYFRTL
ncbi:cytochrome c [Flavobacteriaceae bacterium F08102]|nr:cytochrome c [Flavobacteriaceae bacterium F08102]